MSQQSTATTSAAADFYESEGFDLPELPSIPPFNPPPIPPPIPLASEKSPTPIATTSSLDQPGSSSSSSVPPSEQTQNQNQKTRERHQRPSECAVCGNQANGYHYEVASCNGCKTFFRRLLMTEKTFACKANKDCFDLNKREKPIKCRACRYEKCINVGMNPLAMKVDETEAQAENFKKLSKRTLEHEYDGDEDKDEPEQGPSTSSSSAKCKTVARVLFTMENKMEKIIDMLTYLEHKVEIFRKSAYNPDWKILPGLLGLIEEQNKISIADRAGPMPGWPLEQSDMPPPPPNKLPPFGHAGGPKPVPPSYDPVKKMWLLYDLLTTVEYAKTFMFFHQLDVQDRFILLQYVSLACMNLHISHFTIKQKFDRVIHPDGTLAPHIHGMVYAETTMSISPLLRYEVKSTEYVLLKAICLCNPAVPGLSDFGQKLLLKEREKFASTLFDYCIRDPKLGASHFAHLIGIIDTLEHQQRIQKDLHLLFFLPMRKRRVDKKFHDMLLVDDIMEN